MRKNLLVLVALFGISLVFTGCNAVQGYSVRSYQGPLPMSDYQYITQDGSTMGGR